VVEVVVVRIPRRPAVLEALQDHKPGIEDRHGDHQQGCHQGDGGGSLEHALDGDRGEQEAERERAGIAHKDPRRVVVVAEEGERRATDDHRERGRVDAVEGGAEDGERGGRDSHKPRRERIHAVDQVDQVGQHHDPEHGQRVLGVADVVIADKRQGYVIDRHVVADHRNQGYRRHPDQLRRRADATDVVEQPEGGNAQRADQDPRVGAARLDQ
jgi:hypothetical protein